MILCQFTYLTNQLFLTLLNTHLVKSFVSQNGYPNLNIDFALSLISETFNSNFPNLPKYYYACCIFFLHLKSFPQAD